jgi:hypothetical protein
VFEICGHITSFGTTLGGLAGELGASVDFAASPVAPVTRPVPPTMSMVSPIGWTVPPGIVIVGPPIRLERLSRGMVDPLGTLVRHTMPAVPFRMPIVPPHTSVKSLSDAVVGPVGAAVAVRIAPVHRAMSPVPPAIAVAPALDKLVHPANAFVGPTMPRVPMADAMVASATSPVQAHMSFVALHASFKRSAAPSVHVLAHPMRSPLPVRPPVGRRAGAMLIIAAERRPTTARPKGEGRVV